MNSGMTEPQEDLYEEAQELFNDVRSKPWLAEGMREHGYNEEIWGHGQELFDTAYNLARAREAAQSAQLDATNTVNRLYESAWPHFQMMMQNCEALLQGQTGWLILLGLHEARQDGNGTSQIDKPEKGDSLAPTLIWLHRFYDVLQTETEIAAVLAKNGISAEKIANDAARVTALEQASRHQDEAITARKRAVKVRNAAFTRLQTWLRCTQRAAEIVKKEHEEAEEAGIGLGL